MTRALWWLALGIGCGGELELSPTELNFGTVDFNQTKPGTGYNPIEWSFTNVGGVDLQPVIRDVDDDRLTVAGRLEDEDPPWFELPEESVVVLTVGVNGYEAGEWDTEVSGVLTVTADGLKDDLEVPFTYTPTREFGE